MSTRYCAYSKCLRPYPADADFGGCCSPECQRQHMAETASPAARPARDLHKRRPAPQRKNGKDRRE